MKKHDDTEFPIKKTFELANNIVSLINKFVEYDINEKITSSMQFNIVTSAIINVLCSIIDNSVVTKYQEKMLIEVKEQLNNCWQEMKEKNLLN